MGRPRKDHTAEEEHAAKLITAQSIYQNLQHAKQLGVFGIPARFQAGAPDPWVHSGNKTLAQPYRYYRVAAPDSGEGRRQIEFLKHLGYEPATDGEYFPTMQGGKIFRCHPTQYDEATRAMKMVASREHTRAAQNARHRLQENARFGFGSADVTAEIETRAIHPSKL